MIAIAMIHDLQQTFATLQGQCFQSLSAHDAKLDLIVSQREKRGFEISTAVAARPIAGSIGNRTTSRRAFSCGGPAISTSPQLGLVYIPATVSSSSDYAADPNYQYQPGQKNKGRMVKILERLDPAEKVGAFCSHVDIFCTIATPSSASRFAVWWRLEV